MLGDTQSEFSERYGIPFRTIQNWESKTRKAPEYITYLLEQKVRRDLVNRKTYSLPLHDPKKIDLPRRKDYIGSFAWLKAIQNEIKENLVFALDQALMCEERFLGRNDEPVIWVYGNDSLIRYNGIAILGNEINLSDVKEDDGIKYTSFNRTVYDALANEPILDMQGITEALSNYYYSNSESFEGIFVCPEYHELFEKIADDAIHYYDE